MAMKVLNSLPCLQRNLASVHHRSFLIRRCFGNIGAGGPATGAELDASKLTVIRRLGVDTPLPPLEDLKFGQFFTDHFLDVDWDKKNGWNVPFIRPMQNIQMHPGASALHYGLQVFEGLKAFRAESGEVLLFRPERNMARFFKSATRMALPGFNERELLRLMARLVKLEERFVPKKDGFSLYIRPSLFSTHPNLGVARPEAAKLNITLCPCGPYYPTGFKPVQLLAEDRFQRAFPGGVGDCKVGGNYGPTIHPQALAAKEGYTQLLWLFATEGDHMITEVGTMNLFIYWINNKGEKELVTPPLEKNLILPGVTRECILELAKQWTEFPVREQEIFMKRDLVPALKENRILEIFGSGTAAVVSPVDLIHYQGNNYKIPLDPKVPEAGSGPLAKRLLDSIYDIQYGRQAHEWSVPVSSLL